MQAYRLPYSFDKQPKLLEPSQQKETNASKK